LRCILRRCGVPLSTPHSPGFVRFASGAFYFAIPILTFYESINYFGSSQESSLVQKSPYLFFQYLRVFRQAPQYKRLARLGPVTVRKVLKNAQCSSHPMFERIFRIADNIRFFPPPVHSGVRGFKKEGKGLCCLADLQMTEPAKGRVGFFELNDKNSLCWRESIGGMALYGNGKVSTTYAVIGLGYSERACEGCQGQAGMKYGVLSRQVRRLVGSWQFYFLINDVSA